MSTIVCRPVYSCRLRSLRGYAWGVFAGDVLTAVYARYPSRLMREIKS